MPEVTFRKRLDASSSETAPALLPPQKRAPTKVGGEPETRGCGAMARCGVTSAQTAWIGDSAGPPAQAGTAQSGGRAGRYGPHRDCNHIDLPLGTGAIAGSAGLPKRTRYVVA